MEWRMLSFGKGDIKFMNNERRKKIAIIKMQLNSIIEKLKNIADEEEYAYESMPEGIQASLRGMESEDAIDLLQEALELLDEADSRLGDIP